MIRHKVYHKIKTKQKKSKQGLMQLGNNLSGNMNTSDSGLNNSEMSQSVIVGEEDIQDLIKELDIEAIRKEVFNLYDVKYGLDTQLALRKVQVIEAEDQMF